MSEPTRPELIEQLKAMLEAATPEEILLATQGVRRFQTKTNAGSGKTRVVYEVPKDRPRPVPSPTRSGRRRRGRAGEFDLSKHLRL